MDTVPLYTITHVYTAGRLLYSKNVLDKVRHRRKPRFQIFVYMSVILRVLCNITYLHFKYIYSSKYMHYGHDMTVFFWLVIMYNDVPIMRGYTRLYVTHNRV